MRDVAFNYCSWKIRYAPLRWLFLSEKHFDIVFVSQQTKFYFLCGTSIFPHVSSSNQHPFEIGRVSTNNGLKDIDSVQPGYRRISTTWIPRDKSAKTLATFRFKLFSINWLPKSSFAFFELASGRFEWFSRNLFMTNCFLTIAEYSVISEEVIFSREMMLKLETSPELSV